MNFQKLAVMLCGAGIPVLAQFGTAQGSDPVQEYNQVRAIAMRDPKVRTAFDKANQELEKKMIQIDPALKPLIEKQRGAKTKIDRAKNSSPQTTHIVANGETLTSISRHYKVPVNSLIQVNHISKEATLKIGQKLLIPIVNS
jgi:hypothetical protein